MTRFILAAVAAAVVVADGIVLVGFTSAVPGSAMPVRTPVLAPAPSSAAPTSSSAPPSAPPAAGAPTTTGHPRSTQPNAGNTAGRNGQEPRVKSPFAERCRTGQIPAWLCQGLPG
jgi:hypothetical protein